MTKVLTVQIDLMEPLLAAGLEGDPNAATGLAYVPGAMLRGAVINKFQGNKDASDADFRRLFLDGTTCFLNGYPAAGTTRLLPCPLSIMKDKHRPTGNFEVHDHAVGGLAQDSTVQWQPIQQSAPFGNFHDSSCTSFSPDRTIHIHTQRDRRRGRAVQGAGAVFRYEALASKQRFLTHIICQDQDEVVVRGLLPENVCLGGSRTAGYGHCWIKVLDDAVEIDHWSEWGGLNIGYVGDVHQERLHLTLLSDLILRDSDTGRHSTSPGAVFNAVASALGITHTLDQCAMFLRSTIHGGFNRRWGLPLPQATAVAMGSVIVIDKVTVGKEQLRSLLINGLGERRAEGFGRMAVGWNAGASFDMKPSRPRPEAVQVVPIGAGSAALQEMQERIRERRIEATVQSRALKVRSEKLPSGCRSRLQNLKLAVHSALVDGSADWNDLNGLRGYLEKLKSRKTVRARYCEIVVRDAKQKQAVLEWLDSCASSAATEEIEIPNLSTGKIESYRLEGVERYKFRLKVISTVLGRLIKQSKVESRGMAKS